MERDLDYWLAGFLDHFALCPTLRPVNTPVPLIPTHSAALNLGQLRLVKRLHQCEAEVTWSWGRASVQRWWPLLAFTQAVPQKEPRFLMAATPPRLTPRHTLRLMQFLQALQSNFTIGWGQWRLRVATGLWETKRICTRGFAWMKTWAPAEAAFEILIPNKISWQCDSTIIWMKTSKSREMAAYNTIFTFETLDIFEYYLNMIS